MEIDYQGALQIRKIFSNAILIFILPPSWEELRSRLERRGEDTPEIIDLRLKNAALEVAQAKEFDFVIINDILSQAQAELVTVVQAARLLTTSQMARHPETFKSLGID